jgi:hypothetical protein
MKLVTRGAAKTIANIRKVTLAGILSVRMMTVSNPAGPFGTGQS